MSYDGVELILSVRYGKFIYQTSSTGVLLNPPSSHIEESIHHGVHAAGNLVDEGNVGITLNDNFYHNGMVQAVHRMTASSVTARILDPPVRVGEYIEYAQGMFATLLELINNYNN